MLIIRFGNNFFRTFHNQYSDRSQDLHLVVTRYRFQKVCLKSFFIAVSLIILVRKYFCCCLVYSEIHRLAIHSWWSVMLLNIMEDEMVMCFLWVVLQNIWSMRLHECLDNMLSCRQIAPKYRLWEARLSITGNRLLNFALTLNVYLTLVWWIPLGYFVNIEWISDKSTYCEWQKFVISFQNQQKLIAHD